MFLNNCYLARDLRPAAKRSEIVRPVYDQETFDELFHLFGHHERNPVVRVADAVAKITLTNSGFLIPHKVQSLALLKKRTGQNDQFAYCAASTSIPLNNDKLREAWGILTYRVV